MPVAPTQAVPRCPSGARALSAQPSTPAPQQGDCQPRRHASPRHPSPAAASCLLTVTSRRSCRRQSSARRPCACRHVVRCPCRAGSRARGTCQGPRGQRRTSRGRRRVAAATAVVGKMRSLVAAAAPLARPAAGARARNSMRMMWHTSSQRAGSEQRAVMSRRGARLPAQAGGAVLRRRGRRERGRGTGGGASIATAQTAS